MEFLAGRRVTAMNNIFKLIRCAGAVIALAPVGKIDDVVDCDHGVRVSRILAKCAIEFVVAQRG